jgi:chromosome segregation ATPase
LSNKGVNPYPSIRGSIIVIERKILRSGSSEYRIYDSQNRTMGTLKEDVNAICDHFGIQIDNPLVLLTQETAKRFLANAKPSDLYEFFMKSTQLEQLQFDYIFSQNRIAEAKQSLNRSKERLGPLSENIAKLERKLAEIEQFRMAEIKIKALRQELVWAHVQKKETVSIYICKNRLKSYLKDQQELKNQSLQFKIRIQEIDAKLESNQNIISKLEINIKELEDEMSKKLDQIHPLVNQKNEIIEFDSIERNNLLLIERDIKDSIIEIKNHKNIIESIASKIADEAKNKANNANSSERLRVKLEEVDQITINFNNELANLNLQKNNIIDQKEFLGSQREELLIKLEDKSREVKKISEHIRKMENSKNNRLKLFDERMPDLISEISKNPHFKVKPIGPAGIHLRLKDDRWIIPMNAIINNDLEAFIVDNSDDHQLLLSILKKYKA